VRSRRERQDLGHISIPSGCCQPFGAASLVAFQPEGLARAVQSPKSRQRCLPGIDFAGSGTSDARPEAHRPLPGAEPASLRSQPRRKEGSRWGSLLSISVTLRLDRREA
jgi:hypothetical protein